MGNQIPTGTPPVQGIADPLKVVTKLVTTSPEKCLKKQPKIDIFKTGNGFMQTGYGIIPPSSMPLNKKLLLRNVLT